MNTKLTLSIDAGVVKKAKQYAKENGRSLSALIETYLIGVTSEHEAPGSNAPITGRLLGSFKVDEDIEISKVLSAKYKRKS